jgi:phytoene synthase
LPSIDKGQSVARDSGERSAGEAVVRTAARSTELDRYLAALLAPRAACADLMALAAFQGEIASIPIMVSEPMIGEIRLQWWREALANQGDGTLTGNPIADAVGTVMRARSLPEELFLNIIDARLCELDPHALFVDRAVDTYFDGAEGAAFQLAAHVLGISGQPGVSELMYAAGQAYGRVRLLRILPHVHAKGPVPGPLDGAISSSDNEWAAGVAPMRSSIISWLVEARRLSLSAPKAVLPAILPLALVEPYLAALERQALNSVGGAAAILPVTRVWRLWWASALGRV